MSHSSQKIKKDSNLTINAQITPKMNISNLSSFSKVNNIKNISHEMPIMITPLDFIKQKKKFIIQDSFDKRGAKNFLKSKEEAMMEIKLDDEILEETKDKNKYNKNSSFVETKPDTNYSKNKIRKRTITISPVLRKKKSKFGKSKNNQFGKIIDDDANNIFINNKNLENSKGSDLVYKFILENANETEDNFQKKYEKIKEIAKNKQKNKNLNKNKYHTTIDKNQGNIPKFNSAKVKKKRVSIFDFSEHAKNLMKNAGLDESSISFSNDNNKKSAKRNSVDSIKNSGKKNNAFLEQKDLNLENIKSGVSIFSIIDNLG